MTDRAEIDTDSFDPSGSIFLPKTDYPVQEFNRWSFELFMGRGIGRDLEAHEIISLHAELEAVRSHYLGGMALRTTKNDG